MLEAFVFAVRAAIVVRCSSNINLFAGSGQPFEPFTKFDMRLFVAAVDIVAGKNDGVGFGIGENLLNKGIEDLRRQLERDLIAAFTPGKCAGLDPVLFGNKMCIGQQVERRILLHQISPFAKV